MGREERKERRAGREHGIVNFAKGLFEEAEDVVNEVIVEPAKNLLGTGGQIVNIPSIPDPRPMTEQEQQISMELSGTQAIGAMDLDQEEDGLSTMKQPVTHSAHYQGSVNSRHPTDEYGNRIQQSDSEYLVNIQDNSMEMDDQPPQESEHFGHRLVNTMTDVMGKIEDVVMGGIQNDSPKEQLEVEAETLIGDAMTDGGWSIFNMFERSEEGDQEGLRDRMREKIDSYSDYEGYNPFKRLSKELDGLLADLDDPNTNRKDAVFHLFREEITNAATMPGYMLRDAANDLLGELPEEWSRIIKGLEISAGVIVLIVVYWMFFGGGAGQVYGAAKSGVSGAAKAAPLLLV